jgi:hypothetical protein
MTTVAVDEVTLQFLNYWPSTMVNPPGLIHPNPYICLETSEDPLVLMAVSDPETGTITLVEDPAKVQAKTAQAWQDLRSQRNARLAASDWVALSDAHLSQDRKDAWFAYRQALRDLPDEVTITSPADLDAVEWPQINTPS